MKMRIKPLVVDVIEDDGMWLDQSTMTYYDKDSLEPITKPRTNLKKEVKSYIKHNFTITDEIAQIPEEDRRYSMWEDDMVAFARHFYELGLAARKGE